ncbi:hypothetical protein [Sphingomonas sp. CFBP 13720]|uniref:hypothetical protein n=1 Tax=Sphingomonas sp. CFBP 13720 TaxID=2775302 RepID=UPI00177AB6D5|nr:hypothetical protein [Sphingomonas sp. CFBP 13720]MBD8678792.1 hypothetical protein [Sphingomonas sp. CFBP 13720]
MVSIGTTWDRTVDFVRSHLGTVMPVVIITQFLPGVVSGSLEGLGQDGATGTRIALGILTLAVSIVSLWGGLFITALAALEGGRATGAIARDIATRRFLPLVGVSILLLLIVAVAMLPGVLIAMGSGFDFAGLAAGAEPAPEQFAALGPAALYFVLVGPFLLWLFARLLPVTAVVALERRGAGAIPRAFALTRGMALKLIGVLILYAIVAGVAMMAVSAVFGAVFALFSDAESPVSIGAVVIAIAISAVSAALALFQSAFIGKLYRGIVGEEDKAAVFE